jgi:hypothetical protein
MPLPVEPKQNKKMKVNRSKEKKMLLLAGCSCLSICSQVAWADMLKGEVQENDGTVRLSRPSTGSGGNNSSSLRLDRPTAGNGSPMTGLVNTSQFSQPLMGNAQNGSMGLVRPDEFRNLSAQKFDLGADRGSRELLIAWDRWYKQLSAAIYNRWSQVADIAGHATVRLTVSKDRTLSAVMVQSSGNPEFDSGLISAIMSLNGNPGLTFPAQSQRQAVSLESDYIAGSNVDPGYSWVRGDTEKVNQSY